jgi:ribonuclease J
MINVMTMAMELGYLHVPEGLLIDINALNRYNKEQVVLITTGSQGEPMSALSRMASGDHRRVEVGPGDFIIISANPIPGNEKTVGKVINGLMKLGCRVVYESMYEVHVSGHACQGETKILMGLVKPKYYIPVHGEQKHLQKSAEIAKSMGIPQENIFIGNIGNTLELTPDSMKQVEDVPAGRILVDGLGVGDVGSVVLRDRKHLAEDGLLVIVCTIDAMSGSIASGPDIVSRGFVYVRESEELMEEARKLVTETVERCAQEHIRDWSTIKLRVRDGLSRFLYQRTRRSPMILPIIMEV